MLHSILTIDEKTDTSNGYFYDHLHNQIYLVQEGQLFKKHINGSAILVPVQIQVHQRINTKKIFPSLTKIKGDCKFNLQKTSFTTESHTECSVRTDIEISDGSVWSWQVPGSLSKVKLGVVEITKSNNIFETFVEITASSSRTVTFAWTNNQLKTWVNGQVLSKNHIKPLKPEASRESKFYALATVCQKGKTIFFNPFSKTPNEPSNFKFKTSDTKIQASGSESAGKKLKKITQLNKDKLLLVTENDLIKIIHRNSITNRFEFPSVTISSQGQISGLFTQNEFDILSGDSTIQQFWKPLGSAATFSADKIKALLENSIHAIQKAHGQNKNQSYRIILQKTTILRTLSSEFNLVNPVQESQLDRSFYSDTLSSLSRLYSNSFPSSILLNNEGWTKIEGKIQDITENYILTIDEETVIVYHIGERVKEVFKENIVFFEFNKSSFLERFNESELRVLKKGEKSSSIYKILMNCFQKEKKSNTEVFSVKENDLKEMIHDYKINESDAKLSLEQTGSVDEALVWLSRPQTERVYIEKHEELKSKGSDQEAVSGSLLELNDVPLSKILLKVNNQIYLLGYDPTNLSNCLAKGQKQFVNLFDFHRESNIEEIDQSQWFNSQNHQNLTIIDGLILKEKCDFLFKEEDKIYICKTNGEVLSKAQIIFSNKLLFECESSINLGVFEPFEGENVTRDITGEVFWSNNKKLENLKCYCAHTFIHNDQLFSNLSSNIQTLIEVEASVSDQQIVISSSSEEQIIQSIPLTIESGPPGVSNHYTISSILNPGSTFLANYPQEIRFTTANARYMRVSSVVVERDNNKLTVNELKEGWIYFENESGTRSKKYHFTFAADELKKEVEINEKGFWKFMVLSPIFNTNKKMPFEFGYIGAKGTLIESQIYQELLFRQIEQSLVLHDTKTQKPVLFEVKNVVETSNKVLRLILKPTDETASLEIKIKSMFSNVLQVVLKKTLKPELSSEEQQEQSILKNLEKVESKMLVDFFSKANLHVHLIKQISKRKTFSFKSWGATDIRKFVDLVLGKANDLKPQIFRTLFDKILESEQGQKYIKELCKNIGKCYFSFPSNHLSYLMKKINPNQLQQNLKDLLQKLTSLRSAGYKDIRKKKIPYLLLEQNFSSRYYLDQIQKLQKTNVSQSEIEKVPVFEELTFIPAEIVVLRDEFSRKLYVKLDSDSSVTSLVLRFDKTQTSSRLYFKVYSLHSQRTLISKGLISQHQWAQATENPHPLNVFIIPIGQAVRTGLIEIEILYNETGIAADEQESKNFPFIDIIPQVYGDKFSSSKNAEPKKSFESIVRLFKFSEEEGFYLSSVDFGLNTLEKFSISRENEYEYTYFKPSAEKIQSLRASIAEKIEKKDYLGAIPDHKKLVSTFKKHSKQSNLDYVYTLLMLTFEEIFNNNVILSEDLCKELFEKIIQEQVGPIRISAFKAASSCVNYLIKSLPFIEEEGYIPNLEKVTFHTKDLEEIADLKNAPLCSSLNKLVVSSIPYADEWAKFLIHLNPVTQKYEENIKYILNSGKPWYKVSQILAFFDQVPEHYFSNILLHNIDGPTLVEYILESKKNNKTSRAHLLVEKMIQVYNGKIDLDIVTLMLAEKDIKWHNLYKIIKICHEAKDIILSQFLEVDQQNAAKLAESYPEIVDLCAKSEKHSQNFAAFLRKLFEVNRKAFKYTILNLSEDINNLHPDMIEILIFYLYEQSNFGGVEGSKILTESELLSIQVAQTLLKKINFGEIDQSQFAEGNQDETLIEWYFCNNSYEHLSLNPANKSPGLLLIKSLSEKILQLIQSMPIDKILKVFDRLIKEIQSQSIPLSTKHIYINQINEGVSQLLGKSINPESLSKILVSGENNDMLKRIFDSLASLTSKSTASLKEISWKSKEVDFIEKFGSTTSITEKIKDWEANRSGSKNVLFKLPINDKRIQFKTSDPEGHILSKIVIGFNAPDNPEKSNIYPSTVQVYGGDNERNLVKICDLKQINDQHFETFSTRVYGVNFNSLPFRKCASPVHVLEFRLCEPLLTSVSDLLENSQKVKKDAFYSVSFVSLMGYENQPQGEPSYNQIYMTLLSFLSNPKYEKTLKEVVGSGYFKSKSGEILKLLNSLLPNKQIQVLLLALNNQNQDVLDSILQNKRPNINLIQSLLEANPSAKNITKLLKYFMVHHSEKLTPIIVSSIKLFSYSNPKEKIEFDVDELIKLYEASGFKNVVFTVLAAVLSTPAAFVFDYNQLIEKFWAREETTRVQFYRLIGATIAYYNDALSSFLSSGKTYKVTTELTTLLSSRNSSIYNHVYLLSQLSLHHENRQFFIAKQVPITLVNSLRNQETLLAKEYGSSMKYFILFFQSTCIHSSCEEIFSEILIEMMVKLPDVAAAHHNFFIHEFFFPLINAFKGIPVKFVWKNSQNKYLYQATHSLKTNPIKSNDKVVIIDGQYLSESSHKEMEFSDGLSKFVFLDKDHKIVEQNQSDQTSELKVYKIVTEQTGEYLTNQTLIKLKNVGIFGSSYLNKVPVQDSTYENVYYLPCEMSLNDVLKQVNLCGYRLNEEIIKETQFTAYGASALVKETPIEQVLSEQQSHFAVIEVNPESLFSHTTIETICDNKIQPPVFIPQKTIFKAFEKKGGLMKMITVLKTCVKNWNNRDQSKIWQQYLSELESYSCFPVFSSLYMNKQDNVQLLFDILSGLPDKEDSKKWVEVEKSSVKFLYNIVKDVFEVQGTKALEIRKYAVEKGFYKTMLDRLHLVSKEPKRTKVEEIPEAEEEIVLPTDIKKIASEEDYKLKVVKKKGIGYGNDSSSNQKWDITGQQETRKEVQAQILDLLKILEKFLDHKMFEPTQEIVQQSYESALLPIIEASLRGGSLLEISKSAELFKGQLSFIKALTKKKTLVPILMSIPKCYEPKQHQSVFELLKVLESTSKIFLTCLTGSVSEKLSEEIAKGILETYEQVQNAVSNYELDNIDEDEEKKILELPLAKKYPLLLKDLRFDYIDMKDKNGKISKHHYHANFVANHKSPPAKTIRLAQELADISHALPVEHTNAIYVRCDKERVDFMQALIMGSNGTPYGHGAYLFDIYFDDTYPNNPPKVNLTTTGNGQIRFNPNLYSCGKVCLSLLGTWRGSAMENWDSKVSTLLQVLVSIQSIIMSQEVYFNEPGFEHQQGTTEGEKKNEAYANIVRYGNIKFAMIDNMKNPPKGFEHIIRRHFYLKKDQILEETRKWLKYAQKREASYTGLISDHNNNWCNTFKKSKTEYKTMLEKAINQLEEELNKLPEPSNKDLKSSSSPKKQKKKQVKIVESKDENIEEVDVTYDKTQQNNLKELDINDEKVKDRWSRYIGAMGIEAVSKQSKASILLFGLGATGVEIAKNIILSGCKRISIVDENNTQITDLSGQFFLDEEDLGKNRVDACLYKLQELNHYVRVEGLKFNESDLEVLKNYDVVILTEQTLTRQKLINQFCHKNGIKFIITDCYGPFGQHFNDFGKDFEVLDKNGEETVEVMIENITNAEKGVVTLLNKQRHPYEDGEAVRITGIKGMTKKNGQSINGTIHKIRVINQFSFEIGNTLDYSPYEIDGVARNMKLPIKVEFKPLEESLKLQNIDANLVFYDFEKSTKNTILHKCIIALSTFREKYNKYPAPWNWEDGETFVSTVKQIYTQELKTLELNFIRTFAYTCSGTFAPLAAFYGGLTAQEAFKAITGKYMPINQYFFTEFTQVVPTLPETEADIQIFLNDLNYKESPESRNEGLRRIIGNELTESIEKCRVFLIGSGAIGCELLKNYAMINLATSKDGGQIIVTDPDHIEESNLNRQFLFREKHLRKPKSVTAAAAVSQMNKLLKGKIRAKLDRVCESTKDIFSNEFFESLNIVTNALDNVKARQYVDQRCVENKVALLESGTLSSKGHVQVIMPYITQTYGSKADPAEEGEIPHCTLKMFPEETLHCVEWARDIFGKTFTLDPKALGKLLEKWKEYNPSSADLEMLKSCFKMLEKKPENFEDAIKTATYKFFELYRNDIKQLLYTYPLDAKTKDGKPFWKLPKRPPTPIEQIDPSNELHRTFITSYAVLLCKVFNVEYPKDFRKEDKKVEICKQAAKIKIEPFVPNDKLAKQMAEEVDKNETGQEETDKMKESEVSTTLQEDKKQVQVTLDQTGIFENIKKLIESSKYDTKVNAEEFEKDDDQNGHIDLIYSMANLRATNYKLEPMDWMTTKLKAGRITPALSTTTSCVAALQTIELIKYLKKCKLDKMRNTFINLAVPIVQAGEPGEVEKIKIHDNLTTNIWERWEIGPIDIEKVTVGELLSRIEEKYMIQVKILSILEGAQIYSDLVLGLESKKEEKAEYLRRSLKEVLLNEIPAQDFKKFVDLTLVFATNDVLAKHVPTLRVKLNE